MRTLIKEVAPGVTTASLNDLALRLIEAGGDTPAFLGYRPGGSGGPYPAALCVSVNDEVVHGLPGERVLQDGDIVGLDLGLSHQGFFTDMAVTLPVGTVSAQAKKLLEVTEESLMRAVAKSRVGNRVGDIGAAVEDFVTPFGYGIVRDLGGHGVGKAVHEEPFVPNFGRPGTGPKLSVGEVIAIEPMINLGGEDVYLADDDFTYKTEDGSISAHFEVTVLITPGDPIIITQ
jgi:methionyl aminopeptidase